MVNNALTIKKKHCCHIGPNFCAFLGMGDISESHCKEWAFVSTS